MKQESAGNELNSKYHPIHKNNNDC